MTDLEAEPWLEDVRIHADAWGALKADQRCYVPKLLTFTSHLRVVSRDFSALSSSLFQGTELYEQYLATSAVTRLMKRRPMGIDKCKGAVATWNRLAEDKGWAERLGDADITLAVFWTPSFATQISEAGLSFADFADPYRPGHGEALAQAAADGYRMPLAVGLMLARTLATKLKTLELRQFLSTYSGGRTTVPPDTGEIGFFDGRDLQPCLDIEPAWRDWRDPAKLPAGVP